MLAQSRQCGIKAASVSTTALDQNQERPSALVPDVETCPFVLDFNIGRVEAGSHTCRREWHEYANKEAGGRSCAGSVRPAPDISVPERDMRAAVHSAWQPLSIVMSVTVRQICAGSLSGSGLMGSGALTATPHVCG